MPRTLEKVVFATDFSPGSTAALRALERLLPPSGPLRLYLVHVLDPLVFAAPPLPVAVAYEPTRERDVRRALERIAARLRRRLGARARIALYVPAGPAHAEICRVAKQVRAGLIVLGTHGRTGLQHMLVGSVAERVVQHAGRPVLTVPLGRGRASRG
jgi:universal stress protein A